MSLVKHIPNTLTLGNLACGLVAIKFGIEERYSIVFCLVIIGAAFDFFDGFVARLLNVNSAIGIQLDSLADLVTFGVVPAIVMFSLLASLINYDDGISWQRYLSYTAFVIGICSAIRLAKFNVDESQSSSFRGLPTPANALFFVSLPLALKSVFVIDFIQYEIWIAVVVAFSLLMVSNLPMFALKFKWFGWKGNEIRWVFLGLCLCITVGCLLAKMWALALPLFILLYILLSVLNNLIGKKNEV